MNTSSVASLWMMVNQLQIFFLLLLSRAFIPDDIQTIIKGSDFASNIYSYIPLKKINMYPTFLEYFEFELKNSMLESLGIKYNGTIANTFPIFVSLIPIIILHLWIYILKWVISKWAHRDNPSKCTKLIKWLIEKSFNLMTFGYYIVSVLETSQFVIASSTNEIYEFNTSKPTKLISIIYAILMIILFLAIVGFILYLILSSYRTTEDEHNKLEEFFSDIKANKISRFSVIALLLRRFVFVVCLITLVSIPSNILIDILASLQVIYTIYISILRAHKEVKGNLIEIINEIYFSALFFSLSFLNTEDKWNTAITSAYMWVLGSNTMVVFIIVFGKKVYNIFSWYNNNNSQMNKEKMSEKCCKFSTSTII